MSVSDQNSGNRSSLMSDLLAKQDEVIRELENLDRRLLSTIEAFKTSKMKAEQAAAGNGDESSEIHEAVELIQTPVDRAA